MKKIHPLLTVLALVALGTHGPAAMAQESTAEEHEVRGEVVRVIPDQNQLRLRVTEVEDGVAVSAGDVTTFDLSEETEIRTEDYYQSVRRPGPMTINDLRRGDRVTLHFAEVGGRPIASAIEREEAAEELAAADTADDMEADATEDETEAAALETGRDTLPATATFMPLLALMGLGFAGLAAAIRYRRR